MKRLHLALLSALAICAAGAVGASAASAALPELGRCAKTAGTKEGRKTIYHGAYKEKKCVKPAVGNTGKFEFAPGPGPETEFYGAAAGEPVTLETVGGTKIECIDGGTLGNYTGPKSEKLKFEFVGCTDSVLHAQCETVLPEGKETPVEGKIRSLQLVGELGFVSNGAKPVAGWDIKPEAGTTVAEFECGATPGLGTKFVLEGSYISNIKKTNKMSEEVKQSYIESHGKQSPEQFEGGAKDTLSATIVSGVESKTEQIGYLANETVEEYEPLEIKTLP